MFDDLLSIWIINDFAKSKLSQAEQKALFDKTHEILLAGQQKLHHFTKKIDLRRLFMVSFREVALASSDIGLAQNLYRQLFEMGGTGSNDAQEDLLIMLGSTADPAQIPFWEQLLTLTKPRDQWAGERKRIAMMALAYMELRHPNQCAVLWAMTKHPLAKVRFEAIYNLGRLNGCLEDMFLIDDSDDLDHQIKKMLRPHPFNTSEYERLREIATNDLEGEVCLLVRQLLIQTQQALPIDNEEGTYTFKVNFKGRSGMYRSIELRATQTLDDLHNAIQTALDWDNDHLYVFTFGSERKHRNAMKFEFYSPNMEEDKAADDIALGELGLKVGAVFSYLFDFGDDHLFDITVVDIKKTAEGGDYPKFVDQKGDAPKQYRSYYDDNEND